MGITDFLVLNGFLGFTGLPNFLDCTDFTGFPGFTGFLNFTGFLDYTSFLYYTGFLDYSAFLGFTGLVRRGFLTFPGSLLQIRNLEKKKEKNRKCITP